MKKILYIIGVVAALSFASCQKDAGVDELVALSEVSFSGSVASLTKASGTSWAEGDVIGISMFAHDADEVLLDNIKYVTFSEGASVNFVAEDASQTICFPGGGVAVDFCAYYPYNESWNMVDNQEGLIIDISSQDGSAQGMAAADLMLSETLENQTSGVQSLVFSHTLSQLCITVSNHVATGDGRVSPFASLDDVEVNITGFGTLYNLSLSACRDGVSEQITMYKTVIDDNTALYTAIVAPVTNVGVVSITDGQSTYTASIAIDSAQMGTQYSYTASVGDDDYEIVLSHSGIAQWDDSGSSTPSEAFALVDGVYQISSAVGLLAFAEVVNNGVYDASVLLMCDIDLAGSEENPWSPIELSDQFAGVIDGGGFAISGLYLDGQSADEQGVGLFSSLRGATVKNLSVSGTIVNATAASGGIAGYSSGGSFINCHTNIEGDSASAVGQVIADDLTTQFVNCVSEGSLSQGFVHSSSAAADFTNCVSLTDGLTTPFGAAVSTALSYFTLDGALCVRSGQEFKNLYYDSTDDNFIAILNNSAVDIDGACAWTVGSDGMLALNFGFEPIVQTIPSAPSGEGSVSSPYLLTTVDNFKYLHYQMMVSNQTTLYEGSYFKVENDIDFEGSATNQTINVGGYYTLTDDNTAESAAVAFGANIDGNGKTISGLYQTRSSGDVIATGLFAAIGNGAISELTLSGSISGEVANASIGCGALASQSSQSTLVSCHNMVDINLPNQYNVAGLVGCSDQLTAVNCYNSATIVGAGSVAGIAATSVGGSCTACLNIGTISATADSSAIVGASSTTTLNDCYLLDSSVASDSTPLDGATAVSQSDMQSQEFVDTLNKVIYIYNITSSGAVCGWKMVDGDYPALDYGTSPSVYTFNGSGTFTDPYTINSAAELRVLSNFVNAGNSYNGIFFALTCDIDLEGSADNLWTPIGNSTTPFQGDFYGNGHEVSGLYISSADDYLALFGVVVNGEINDIGVSGSVTATASNNFHVAALVGYANATFITNCYNAATVTATGSDCMHIGGLVGSAIGTSAIVGCYNLGSVSGSSYVGGVAGSMSGTSMIYSCYNAAQVSGSLGVGGVIGNASSSNTLPVCGIYNDSTICSAGVVGSSSCTLTSAEDYNTEYMQSECMVTLLNNAAYIYSNKVSYTLCAWKSVEGSYPVVDFENSPDTYITPDIVYDSTLDEYQIYTASGLKTFANLVNGTSQSVSDVLYTGGGSKFNFGSVNNTINAKLMDDIALSGSWSKIGTSESATYGYGGTFDGDGHSITGLYISTTSSSTYGYGLFGYVYNGTVKNLSVGGAVSSYNYHTALIAGDAINATFTSCSTIQGSTVVCNSYNNTAGIVGYASNTTFTDCHNNATITARKYGAGIVGYIAGDVTITGCTNMADITVTYSSGGYAGGIAAASGSSSAIITIESCYNSGTVYSAGDFAGGIIAKMYGSSGSVSTMTNCANVGAVSGYDQYIGGLAGANQGGAIYNCYNRGNVSGGTSEIGGLVGIHELNSTYAAVMNNCYTTGTVTSGSSNMGIVVGKCDSSTTYYCFYPLGSGSAFGSDNNSQDMYVYEFNVNAGLLSSLNANVSKISGAMTWVAGDDTYPTFEQFQF